MEWKPLHERMKDCEQEERRVFEDEQDKIYKETGRENDSLAEARAHIRISRGQF